MPNEAIAGCYLGTLTAADLVDMARAALLLAHGLRQSGTAPGSIPDAAMRTTGGLMAARRMRPSTLRKALDAMHAPPHIYSEFLRLCPGAIAPERA